MSIVGNTDGAVRRFFLSCLVLLFYIGAIAQTPYSITFTHSPGQGNTSLDARGMQPVHELTYVYYMKSGESRTLTMPLASQSNRLKGYSRWYDYTTDSMSAVVAGLTYTAANSTIYYTNYGAFTYQETLNGVEIQPAVSITFDGTPVKIACDVSNYADFQMTKSGSNLSIVEEPTLSYRVIFDIRPASEIATQINTTTPYEDYNFIAPAGATILLTTAMNSNDSTSCYYSDSTSSQTQITSCTMYRSTNGGSSYSTYSATCTADRMYQVIAPSAGSTYYFELRSDNYKIARWKVEGRDTTEIGPYHGTIVSNEEMDEKYNLAAKQDFDVAPEFLDTVTKTTDFVISNKHLNWDECSYGFVYPYGSGSAGNSKQFDSEFPYWSEYAILQSVPFGASWVGNSPTSVRDHNNPGKGCFLYVDANEAPGLVANLVIEGNLCPNSSVYISAWVNNFAKEHTLVNLNIILSGIDESGNETRLQSFTTGSNTFSYSTAGDWYQVFFEVKLGNQNYANYRVRIENNNNSGSGNDFGIDDIRIYTSKNPVQSLEGITACGIKTQQELIDAENGIAESIILLRVDFKSEAFVADNDGNVNINYRWVKGANPIGGDNDAILDLNYVNKHSSGKYGTYVVQKNKTWDEINDTLKYSSINDFVLREDRPVIDGEMFSLQEQVVRPGGVDTVPVLYIVHKSAEFKKYSTYSCLVSADANFRADCGGLYTTKVQNCKQLLIDGEPQELVNLRFKTLSGERDYELSTQVYYNDPNNKGQVTTATPICDWIVGVDDRFIQANLTRSFMHFRTEYFDEKTSVNQSVKGTFTQADLDTLLKYEQYITLRKSAITTNLPGDGTTVQYIVYPIQGSCSDASIPVCPNPMRIRLRSDVKYSYGKQNINSMPEDIQGAPAVVRIAQSLVNKENNKFVLKINEVKGTPEVGSNMYLYRTNDTVAQSHIGEVVYTFSGTISEENEIEFSRTNNSINMVPGYDYKFSARYDTQPFDTAYGCFIVNVVPDLVFYSPKAGNTTWHNDENWVDSLGNTALIPVEGTKVILPVGSTDLVYFDTTSFAEVEGTTYHLNYIYGFRPTTCGSIYFPWGAKISGQQFLKYDSAYVDVPVTKGAYSLFGLPMKKVFSGDLYMPKAGDVIGDDFRFNGAQCDNRITNKILQKVYNSTTTFWSYTKGNTIDSVSTAVAGWGNPSNSLSEEYVNTAVAVQAVDEAVQEFIQLPKKDNTYYFYAVRKATGEEYQVPERYGKADITRGEDCFKLIYDRNYEDPNMTLTYNNVEPDSWFLVTNPFMGDLSVSALMDANPEIIDGFYYTFEDGVMTAESVTPESKIQPAGAFFVHAKNATRSLNITFKPDMVENTISKTPAPALAPANDYQKLTIIAQNDEYRSIATIQEDAFGVNEYDTQEDADMLLFDDKLTPFGVYTRIDNKPLMVNMVRTIEMVPLSVSIIDTTIKDVVITFTGAEKFTRPIYLYDALTDENRRIYSGMTVDFSGLESDAVRYYLNIDRPNIITADDNMTDDSGVIITNDIEGVHCYSQSEILAINIYDVAGHLIKECSNINDNAFSIKLPVGVYVMEVRTIDTVSNNKVIIK
ncbi:MAG: T9SS type A sorting domain-containing protein [Candidatus Aphodosoma sp.]